LTKHCVSDIRAKYGIRASQNARIKGYGETETGNRTRALSIIACFLSDSSHFEIYRP